MISPSAKRVIFAMFAVAVMLTVPLLMMVPDETEATPLDHSDEYYYNQLSEREQGLYRQIYAAAGEFQKSFETGYLGDSLKQVGLKVMAAVRYDHPELIQITGSFEYREDGTMLPEYSCTAAELIEYMTTVEEYCKTMPMPALPAERRLMVEAFNDNICTKVTYDTEAAEKYESDRPKYEYAHSIKGAFVDDKAVCEGYALVFKYMCDLYDIPCICITGDAIIDDKPGAHMWNYVKMGSKWYAMDVTWNDSTSTTDYFLVGSDTYDSGFDKFSETHIVRNSLSAQVTIPEIETDAYTVTIGPDDHFNFQFNSTYYYDKLTANGKTAYTALVEGIKNFDKEIETGVVDDTTSIFDAIRAIRFDRQDLFQITGASEAWSDGKVKLEYSVTEEQYNEMCQKIGVAMIPLETKLSGCVTTYDKVLTIHDYLVSNIVYTKTDNAHDIYGALVNGKCVCEGYARSFQYIASLYGITSIVVSGDGTNSSGTEGHMWSMVLMNDGIWYDLDVTWDDPLVNGSDSGKVYYDYFLVGSETKNDDGKMFSESHVADMVPEKGDTHVFSNSMLPEASKMDYYIRPGANQEFIIEGVTTGSNGSYVATLQLTDLKEKSEYMQGHGTVTLVFGEGLGKVNMTAANFTLLIGYLEANAMTEVSFTYDVRTEKIAVGPMELDHDVFKFGLKNGTENIALNSIGEQFELTLFMPFDASGAEILHPLIFAWDSETPMTPNISSKYADGFVSLKVTSTDSSYLVGSTPIQGVPILYVIAGILATMLVIALLLRHHSKKKARKLAERRAARRKSS